MKKIMFTKIKRSNYNTKMNCGFNSRIVFVIGLVLFILNNKRCEAVSNVGPTITVTQGVMQGRTVSTNNGIKYNSFLGIPYAQPPLGDLRFRDPRPAGKWVGVLNATVVPNAEAQFDFIFLQKYYGSEDCLYLNVYVPTCTQKNLPVMVWIHGGAYIAGEGGPILYGPDYIIERNVILVTVNYRLGAFGFLSLENAEVPGNAGLKDQVLALKWVKDNIRNFGGDPNRITIFGESAGSGSVHLQMLSPLSEDLFHRAIMQSGVSLCPWSIQPNPVPIALKLAEILGLKSSNKTEVIKHLRTISEKDLVFASISPKFVDGVKLAFGPIVEKTFPNVKSFITEAPIKILDSGKYNRVPSIVGNVGIEGLVYRVKALENPADEEAFTNNRVPDLKRFISDELKDKYGKENLQFIENKLKEFYFPTTEHVSDDFNRILSDYTFVKDTLRALRIHAKYSPPVYFYKFSYDGSKNLLRLLNGLKYSGAAHTDELAYLFDVREKGINKISLTAADELISKQMVEMWTNFAKHGNPTPEKSCILTTIWKPATTPDICCLSIDKELKMVNNPFQKSEQFWNNIAQL